MTPHNEAKLGEIASVVLMPGDPMRAKKIAETYLENYELVNSVRGMYAYTGTYKGKRLSVMAHGMGIPSMGIYSYELYSKYNVDTIIRIGSAGSYTEKLNLYDLLLVSQAYSESTYALIQNGCEKNVLASTTSVNEIILKTAEEMNKPISVGTVHSSDVFYKEKNYYEILREKYGCQAVEMESFALFHNASVLGKKAACILTISDSFITQEETTSEERQNSFTNMMELALETAIKLL